MDEQFVRLVPMWILAGISAGWLADTSMARRGYGLVVDMAVGVGAAIVVGSVFQAMYGVSAGMFAMVAIGFAAANGAILGQRLCWPRGAGAADSRARPRLFELERPSVHWPATASGVAGRRDDQTRRPAPARAPALARIAATGIYLLRGIPLELQRTARARALRENTTLGQVLLNGVGEYAAGTWTPQSRDETPVALEQSVRAIRP